MTNVIVTYLTAETKDLHRQTDCWIFVTFPVTSFLHPRPFC